LSPAPRSRTWSPLLHVRQAGSGDAEPLLLIHGLGTSQVIWDAVVPGLARTRRVVTIDLPGFGRSAPAGPGFELGAVADRVARGLAAHGVSGPLDVVGHSLGGAVALTLAMDRPRLVRRLVLVAPAGLHARTLPRPLIQGALGVGAEGRFAASAEGWFAAVVEGWFAARRRAAPLTDLRWGRRLLLALAVADGAELSPGQARIMVTASAGSSRLGAAMAEIARADLRPLLGRTRAPLGLLWGELDRTVPVHGAGAIVAERPDAELEVVAGAGHVPMVERPSEFARALRALLERLDKHATTSDGRGHRLR
jgi:pimeloyl-ACP methyl ester carboxylesterase